MRERTDFLNDHSSLHTNIVCVTEGVYAGKSQAVSGETVYFGMERVDLSNIEQWEQYARDAEKMSGKKGLITKLARACAHEQSYSETVQQRTGFEEEEFTRYMENLSTRKFHGLRIRRALQGIPQGVAGFELLEEGESYVVYASKEPVIGKFQFSRSQGRLTLKKFNEAYDVLLMTVNCEMDDQKDFHENRGIFRNPKSMVDGGYAALSLKLHGFSAAVSRKFFKKKFMRVRPTQSMQNILDSTLKQEDFFIKKEIGGNPEIVNMIHISALENLFFRCPF